MLELDPDAVWSHEEPSLCSQDWKSQEGPTLSNDIWSKFDLLLTPPRTPLRDTDLDLCSLPDDLDLDLPLLEGDGLEVDLDSLDLDVPLPKELTGVLPTDYASGIACSHGQVHDTCSSCEKLALAGSELRHDCMWVGTCTAEAHANQKSRIHHDSTCSHITDLLTDSHGSLELVARFTQLDDLHDDDDVDEEDDDAASHLDSQDALVYNRMVRPDTPSESSETDSDEEIERTHTDDYGVVHEEVVYTSGSPSSTGMVHSDHTYYCLPPPSPPAASMTPVMSPSLLHTPSDSEDEIDVVSVGGSSTDSAYSCSTRPNKRSTISPSIPSPSKKSKNSDNGSKKIFRIHTALPSSPSGKVKRQLQEAVAESVKLKPRKIAGKGTGKSAKRLLQRGSGGASRKRNGHRTDPNDDPDKREMHNSLERMRRVDLRNAFEDLRILVPDLLEKEKAPKVEILKRAAQYCYQMTDEEQGHLLRVEREKKYRSTLLKRYHALQRQLR